MAYLEEWNEEIPEGLEPANTIDDIIVELKVALGERLEEAVLAFRDDGVLPKVPRIPVGITSERPESPLGRGHLFLSTDERTLSIGLSASEWLTIDLKSPITSGLHEDRPEEPEAGQLYWSTDERILSIWNGTEWLEIDLAFPDHLPLPTGLAEERPEEGEVDGEVWVSADLKHLSVWFDGEWIDIVGAESGFLLSGEAGILDLDHILVVEHARNGTAGAGMTGRWDQWKEEDNTLVAAHQYMLVGFNFAVRFSEPGRPVDEGWDERITQPAEQVRIGHTAMAQARGESAAIVGHVVSIIERIWHLDAELSYFEALSIEVTNSSATEFAEARLEMLLMRKRKQAGEEVE